MLKIKLNIISDIIDPIERKLSFGGGKMILKRTNIHTARILKENASAAPLGKLAYLKRTYENEE